MEKIDLDLDNENEMTFRVAIEGTKPGEPLCRLMIENNDITHSITGVFQENSEVSIIIPPMKGMLKEGEYESYLEVLVDDRVFIPLEMKINFEQTLRVVAESVSRRRNKPKAAATLLNTSNRKKGKRVDEEKINKSHPARRKNINNVKKASDQDIINLVNRIKDEIISGDKK